MAQCFVFALFLCGAMAAYSLPATNPEELSNYDSLQEKHLGKNSWNLLGGLYDLLAEHDGSGHTLARKYVRSPSRRLRFGRRSDPDMPPQIPVEDLDELLSLRETRNPVRLRFGRSEERAVPHIFPQEEQYRESRAPSMRLRFGRRSDNNMFLMPYESALPKEVKATSSMENDRQQD